MVDFMGRPVETKKQIYAQAFVIYAFAEYYLLTNNPEVLEKSIEMYQVIEKYSFDPDYKGYFEAFDRKWKALDDLRLSAKDMNEKKTMNTHLHVLEAYTNLYRIFPDAGLKTKIIDLLEVFFEYIIDKSDYHYNLFFDENWVRKSNQISFGHDIEGSWLMLEAAEVINDSGLINRFKEVAVKMATACLDGMSTLGGLSYENERGKPLHEDYVEWWVEAEAAVGFFNAYQIKSDKKFLQYTNRILSFIDQYFIDHNGGEWYSRIDKNGKWLPEHDKAGFWKCPYHNSRMCLELLRRINDLK
jgi:mannobiose 2-epimerase